jgi:hypothetical protein
LAEMRGFIRAIWLLILGPKYVVKDAAEIRGKV